MRQARRMVCMVQCFLGRPTRLVECMLGAALSFLNVACRVGASGGSLRVCRSSVCWACFICDETFGIRDGISVLFPLPFPFPLRLSAYRTSAALLRTSLFVLALSMKVVCILTF